nr:MAG TPA: hypothetical protein [Bacteriophage sp.]
MVIMILLCILHSQNFSIINRKQKLLKNFQHF